MKILINNLVIKKSEDGPFPQETVLIGELSENGPVFRGCIFKGVIITIRDGYWFPLTFYNCLFIRCTFNVEKNSIVPGTNLIR